MRTMLSYMPVINGAAQGRQLDTQFKYGSIEKQQRVIIIVFFFLYITLSPAGGGGG